MLSKVETSVVGSLRHFGIVKVSRQNLNLYFASMDVAPELTRRGGLKKPRRSRPLVDQMSQNLRPIGRWLKPD